AGMAGRGTRRAARPAEPPATERRGAATRLAHRQPGGRAIAGTHPIPQRAGATSAPAARRPSRAEAALLAPQRRSPVRLRALVRKEFLLLLRDPHALAVLFIMPTLFLILMAGAMSNYLQDKPPALRVTLTSPKSSPYSEFFGAALAAQLPGSDLRGTTDTRSARISLPEDFAESLLEQNPHALVLSFPPQLDKLSREHLRGAVRVALAQTRLLAFLEDSGALAGDLPLAERLQLIQQRTRSPVEERELLASGDLSGRANASQLSVPAWLIFGMFFVALPMAGAFQREQQSGALLRLRALDLNLGLLTLSKLLPYLSINLLQFALLLGIGVYGLPLLGLQG